MLSMPLGVIRLRHFTELGGLTWRWPHFSPAELADSQTGELVVVPAFLDWLEDVRHVYDRPMILSSGYRTPAHQETISGRRTGAHVDGMAVDVLVSGRDAFELEKVAYAQGVMGIAAKQIGPHKKRYLHLDMWTKAPPGLRPRLWSY